MSVAQNPVDVVKLAPSDLTFLWEECSALLLAQGPRFVVFAILAFLSGNGALARFSDGSILDGLVVDILDGLVVVTLVCLSSLLLCVLAAVGLP